MHYNACMGWAVKDTVVFRTWYASLEEDSQDRIVAAVDLLRDRGPSLGRPLADRISTSRHHNMKELIPLGSSIRILYIFDPLRNAILLLGGDKEGQWTEWYRRMVPIADDLYDEYLAELEGNRSGPDSRRRNRRKET